MKRERTTSVQQRTPAYHRVRRLRMELNIAFFGRRSVFGARGGSGNVRLGSRVRIESQHVAGAAAGVQQRGVGGRVDFAAQTIRIDLNQSGKGVELFVPNVLGDFRAADDSAGVADQKFEQRILLVGKRDVTSVPGRGLPGGVEGEGIDRELGRL